MIMRRIALLLIISVMLISFAACGGNQPISEDNETAEVTPEVTETVEEEPAKTEEPAETEEAVSDETISITDMAGREVTVPTQINKVFGSNNTSSILLYTLAPDKMIGWNNMMSKDATALLNETCQSLPVLGNMYGSGKEASAEEVLAASPDIVLITGTKLNATIADDADELQARTGTPVVVVIANMSNYDDAYLFLGGLIGEQERAEELAAYYTEKMAYTAEKSAMVEEPASIYYSRMDDGLTT